jgi:hypothetical protein
MCKVWRKVSHSVLPADKTDHVIVNNGQSWTTVHACKQVLITRGELRQTRPGPSVAKRSRLGWADMPRRKD